MCLEKELEYKKIQVKVLKERLEIANRAGHNWMNNFMDLKRKYDKVVNALRLHPCDFMDCPYCGVLNEVEKGETRPYKEIQNDDL